MPTNNSVNVGLAGSTGTGSFVGSAAPTFTGVPILAAPSATSLTFSSTSGLIGTTTNNNAAAGSVGQYIESLVEAGAAVAVTSVVAKTITSISLTAGDWEVYGMVGSLGAATTATSQVIGGTSLVNDTLSPSQLDYCIDYPETTSPNLFVQIAIPTRRFSIASTTTVFLIGRTVFLTSTCTMFGKICARRVR